LAKNTRDAARRQQAEAEHRRRVEEAESQARSSLSERDKRERLQAGAISYAKGILPGFGGEALKTTADLAAMATLYGRLASGPIDHLFSAPGESAADQIGRSVLNAAGTALDYARSPSKIGAELNAQVRKTANDLNPVTGYAATIDEQKRRGNAAGRNAGAALFNAVTMVEGPGELKRLHDLGFIGKAPTVEHYLAQGASLNEARYLASPYKGKQGSHFVPQRTKLPGGLRIPKAVMDSPFNRIMPAPGAANGQMMKFHFGVDNRYHGGRISAQHGGGGWSGKRLGWEKSSAPVRWWRGMPLPTKLAPYTGPVGLGSFVPED
jgi:hypothetical protein